MKRYLCAGVLCCLLSGLATAANQTIDFSGVVIPNGFASTVDWDGYRVTISGGSQPYMQGPPLRLGTVAPNENVTVRITRIDAADFVAVSANVSNSDENTGMVVAGYNNNALVGGTSTTVAATLTNQTANLASATVDEIRITGQSNASFAEVGFLNNFIVSVVNLPPTLASFSSTRSYAIGAAAITLDGGTAAVLSDGDSADFNGGSVRVNGYIGEVAAQDVLQVGNVGTITLDLGTGNVADSGIVIGQVSSNGQAGADLVVTLNASATVARVQNLVRALQYLNNDPVSPFIHSRTLLTSVSDGDGALPKVYTTTINFTLPADPANTQKVTFNSATTVPDISTSAPASFTSQGFSFALTGGFGPFLQAGGSFPGSPGCNMSDTGGGTITLTVNRTSPAGADFSLDSFVLGNATTQNVSVDLRLNGSSVATRTLAGTLAQRMDFGGLTIDEIRITGNSGASPYFQAGTFDELIYYPSNLSPTIGNLQGDTASFTQAGSAVTLDTNTAATLSDVDSANFDTGSLTVAIVQNKWAAQDVLQVGNIGTITVSGSNVSDSGTQFGTITGNGSGGNNLVIGLNAQSTNARVQNLLRALQYRNSENALPDLGDRSILITVLDGDSSSPAEISTVVRVLPNALPAGRVVTLNYTGLGSQPINTAQVDFQSYRMNISGGFQRYLQQSFEGPTPPGIQGADTGISSLTMNLARVDAADFFLHSLIVRNYNASVALTVKSRNNNVDVQTLTLPAGGTQRLLFTDTNAVDQITFTGSNSSVNGLFAFVDELAVVPPNTAPTATTTVAALAYTENAAAIVIDSGIAITDPDNNWNTGTLRLQITTNAGATDQLSLINSGSVSLSGLNVQVSGVTKGTVNAATVSLGNPLTVTFNASANSADVQAIARAIAYTNLSDAPAVATRTVTYTVTDSATASGSATRQITVTAVNDAPTLTPTSTLAYTENQAATVINSTIAVDDADTATLTSGTVSITANFSAGQDVLGFTAVPATMGNIAGVFSAGVMTMTSSGGSATLLQWQAALRAVTYANSSENPSTAARTVAYVVNDGSVNSNPLNSTVNVVAINDAPVLSNTSAISYTENQSPLAINSALGIADIDSAGLNSGTVSIIGNFSSGQDVLGFTAVPATMGNIAGVYSAGVMTLTSAGGSANLTQWQTALQAVTYANSSDNPSTAARTIAFVVNDGGSSNAINSTVNVTAVNDAPLLSASSTISYTENQAATAVNAAIGAVDLDSTGLISGTVSITANFAAGQDVLGFTAVPATMGNISGAFSAGVMTLTSAGGSATPAQWQAALRAVSYANTSEDPSTAARTIAYKINDGSLDSNILNSTVNVTAVNDVPVLSSGSTISYTENQSPLLINGAITLSDVDSATFASGTVTITANFAASQDLLAFTNLPATMGNIAGTYNAGVMTLVSAGSSATAAQWEAALHAVTYENASDNPTTAARTVAFVVNDGAGSSSAINSTINLTAVNDLPTLANSSTLAYTENGAATPINPLITPADVDNAALASGTVSIGAGFVAGEDTLAFTNVPATMGNIVGVYNAGVLTLTSAGASATVAEWQSALRSVSYTNSSDTPTTAPRNVTFLIQDGGGSSNAVNSTITVTAVNDVPLLTSSSVLAYSENQPATTINTAITLADADNATLMSGSVSITTNFAAAQDVLAFANVPGTMGNIVGVYNAGVLTLTSAGASATVAEWQTALRAVTYANSSEDPTTAARTVAFLVNDGGGDSNVVNSTINMTAVNDASVLSNASTLMYTENQPATPINTALAIVDVDNTTLAAASVAITAGFSAGEDVLSFTSVPATMGNIAGNYSAGVLTLSSAGASATLAQWQTALRAISYSNSSDDPTTAARTITFAVNDGVVTSNVINSTLAVTAVNDVPALTTSSVLAYTENDAAAVVNGVLTLSDADNATLASGSVSIAANFAAAEDVLAFVNVPATMGNISGAFSAGVMTLTSAGASATVAQWQTALRAVTYANTSNNPSTAARTVAFVTHDGTGNSNVLNSTINLTASNDASVLSNGSALAYTENQVATPINTGIDISDIDNATLANGTVSIALNFAAGEDVLAFTNIPATMGNISGAYAAGVMSLTSSGATATLAQWQAALRAVTYSNSSENPATAARGITFSVNDGGADSNTISSTVNLTAVNDAPIVSAPSALNVPEDGQADLGDVNVSDADSGNGNLTMSFTASAGLLAATSTANIVVSGAPGPSINATGTAAQLDAWLNGGSVIQYTPPIDANGIRQLSIQTTDNGASPGPAATDADLVTINIASRPDAEVVAGITDGRAVVDVGEAIVYAATVRNNGIDSIGLSDNARAQFPVPLGLSNIIWSCAGTSGAVCGAGGNGAIDDPVALPAGSSVSYQIGGIVSGAAPSVEAVFGIAAAPALQSDDPLDNTATDSNEVRMFVDGFE